MAPPLPAVVVASGLGLNLARSRRNRVRIAHGIPPKPTFSRWACEHKRLAVSGAVAGGTWLTVHFALYVIELPESGGPIG